MGIISLNYQIILCYNIKGDNLETFKYQLTNFIRYAGDAFFYPFLIYYLHYVGLDNSQAGLILMIMPLVAIFINPIWSLFSKNVNYNRWFFSILTILEGIGVILLVQAGSSLTLIILTIILIAIVGQPIYILLDSFIVTYTNQNKIEYSSIRVLGSIAYVISTILIGFIIYREGYSISFYIAAALMMISGLILLTAKPLDLNNGQGLDAKSDYKTLLKNKNFYIFGIFTILTIGTMFAVDTYVPTFFKDFYSLNEMNFGFMFGAVILVEVIVVLFFTKFGKKIKNQYIFIIIAAANIIKYVLFMIEGPLWLSIIGMMFRGIAMGTYLYIFIKTLSQIVEPKNLTLAAILIKSIDALYRAGLTALGGFVTNDINNYWIWFLVGTGLNLVSLFFIRYKNNSTNELVNESMVK